MKRRISSRRGVVILVVISLLVLFVTIGLTFAIIASNYHYSAQTAAAAKQYVTPPQRLIDMAVLPLLRDTNDSASPMRNNSVFMDMYGDTNFNGLTGTISSATAVPAGQSEFIDLELLDSSGSPVTPATGFFGGCVFTPLSGNAKHLSTYATGWFQNGTANYYLRVIKPRRDDGSLVIPSAGDRYLINGRAFSSSLDSTGTTTLNEPYDAPDGSNLFLAEIRPGGTVSPSFGHGSTPVIDTDGDGIPDSIWLDIRLPTQTTKDGRLCRPRVAVQCVDLDGRLNLNYHGRMKTVPAPLALTVASVNTPTGSQTLTTNDLPRGHGYGPPEIDVVSGLTLINSSISTAFLLNRYGSDGVPGYKLSTSVDWVSRQRLFEYPIRFSNPIAALPFPQPPFSAFGSSPDLYGELAVGVDGLGQPIYARSQQTFGDENPYEFRPGPDSPFRYSELEAVLRQFDADAGSLDASRLGVLKNDNNLRRLITTHSYDVPAIGVGITDLNNASSTEHLVARIKTVMGGNNALAQTLFSPEILMGMRMDINRAFGNAKDDGGNGTVDEPGEAIGGQSIWSPAAGTMYPPGHPLTAATFRENNFDDTGGMSGVSFSRQNYCRHLYCLMLLLCGYGNTPPNPMAMPPTPGNLPDATVAQACAQWAVNVVDFRDADSINTRFDYDPDPFDGWTPSAFVWGVERPELILGENLAWHDRRTEDRNEDGGTVQMTKDNNNDFDQRLLPRGAFFVELVNPWQGKDDVKPPEIYSYTGAGVPQGVQLSNVAGTSPVWRLAISTPGGGIERVVHFANVASAPAGSAPGGAAVHYTSLSPSPVSPGGSAVIGSGIQLPSAPPGTSIYVTPIGRRNGEPDGDIYMAGAGYSTRRIVLNPNNNTVSVPNNTAGAYTRSASIVVVDRPTKPIPLSAPPASWPVPLSVSEPIGGYNLTGFDSTLANQEGAFTSVKSSPLDAAKPELMKDGPTFDYRRVALQRLADPTQPFNAATNPYITQDIMSVDLVAFNGVDDSIAEPPNVDPPMMMKYRPPNRFASFQRGDNPAAGGTPLFWNMDNVRGNMPAAASDPSHKFPYQLRHSLGDLGTNYTSFDSFPWMTFLNRPFVSQFELMLVPRNDQTGLLSKFSAKGSWGTGTEFRHLGPPLKDATFDFSSQLLQLFDCLHVPSRFQDTDRWANATTFARDRSNMPPVFGTDFLHPPFNRIPTFREPGRLNINTVYHAGVWNALQFPYCEPYIDLNGDNNYNSGEPYSDLNGDGSWTSILGVKKNPPTAMEWDNSRGGEPFTDLNGNGIRDASEPYTDRNGNGSYDPYYPYRWSSLNDSLLRYDSTGTKPLFALDMVGNAMDQRGEVVNTNRNAYFRYQNLFRLGNMVTGRSNVFAIWITLGYFEVDPASGNFVQEVGATTGEIKRHRAFYIVDRTIPVAFEPGVDHNVERAIVLKRFIE